MIFRRGWLQWLEELQGVKAWENVDHVNKRRSWQVEEDVVLCCYCCGS